MILIEIRPMYLITNSRRNTRRQFEYIIINEGSVYYTDTCLSRNNCRAMLDVEALELSPFLTEYNKTKSQELNSKYVYCYQKDKLIFVVFFVLLLR